MTPLNLLFEQLIEQIAEAVSERIAEKITQKSGTTPASNRLSYSIQELAKANDLHPDTIRKWINLGHIRPLSSCRHIRITPQEWERFARENLTVTQTDSLDLPPRRKRRKAL